MKYGHWVNVFPIEIYAEKIGFHFQGKARCYVCHAKYNRCTDALRHSIEEHPQKELCILVYDDSTSKYKLHHYGLYMQDINCKVCDIFIDENSLKLHAPDKSILNCPTKKAPRPSTPVKSVHFNQSDLTCDVKPEDPAIDEMITLFTEVLRTFKNTIEI